MRHPCLSHCQVRWICKKSALAPTEDARQGILRWGARLKRRLEAETSLQVYDATAESASSLAEVVGCDDVGDAAVGEVQVIEEVEGIDTELDSRVFAKDRHLGKAEGFCDGAVEILIAGAIERVAAC